jgi:glyoxylase-like metal-dependent hydrolase (beta-lactamase superfamily II)
VAHEKTRQMMLGPALDFNRPGIESQLPAYIASLERGLATAEAARPPAPEAPALRRRLEEDRFLLEQKRSVRHVFPNLTFSDRLTLYLGGREIQLWHAGRAVTPGDTFVYLPKE